MSREQYKSAVVDIGLPDGTVRVTPAAVGIAMGTFPLNDDQTMHVITAHNPAGEVRGQAENAASHQQLVDAVIASGVTYYAAVGGDAQGNHQETSVATVGLSDAEAIALGARFGQDAVFAWRATGWYLFACDGSSQSLRGWRCGPSPAPVRARTAPSAVEPGLGGETAPIIAGRAPIPASRPAVRYVEPVTRGPAERYEVPSDWAQLDEDDENFEDDEVRVTWRDGRSDWMDYGWLETRDYPGRQIFHCTCDVGDAEWSLNPSAQTTLRHLGGDLYLLAGNGTGGEEEQAWWLRGQAWEAVATALMFAGAEDLGVIDELARGVREATPRDPEVSWSLELASDQRALLTRWLRDGTWRDDHQP